MRTLLRHLTIPALMAWIGTLAAAFAAEVPVKGPERLPAVRLEPERFLGDPPIEVRVVDAPPGTRLRYTTDGTEPTLRNGRESSGPWVLRETTLLKVTAFSNETAITRTSTHSYLFLDGILNQSAQPAGFPHGDSAWTGEPSHYGMDPRVVHHPRYAPRMKPALQALPTLSLVCDPRDLFDESEGLYLNPLERSSRWERGCSLEWIETNGNGGFQIDCGIRIQGNTGRRPDKTPKHSFRVTFKKAYGPGKLRYPVFPDSTTTRFDSLVLRADYNNAWTHWKPEDNRRAQRIRDAWLKDTHRDMGYPAAHSRYVHLYLNGLYWGIYDVAERPDAGFAAATLGGEREDYDVIDDSGLKSGAPGSVQDFRRIARSRTPPNLDEIGKRIDLVHFMDYLLLNYYAGNQDWGEYQNWYVLRRHGEDSRFRHFVWDGEITLQSLHDDVVNDPDRQPMVLATHLARDPEYRLAFADRVQRHCFGTGALTPEAGAARWRKRAAEVEPALLAESARWGSYRRDPPFTLADWQTEKQRLLVTYFPKRTQVLLQQLREAGLYPKVAAPEFRVVPDSADPSKATVTLAPTDTAKREVEVQVTLDGTDPRSRQTGGASESARPCTGVLSVTHPVVLKARARQGTEWSALVEVPIP